MGILIFLTVIKTTIKEIKEEINIARATQKNLSFYIKLTLKLYLLTNMSL